MPYVMRYIPNRKWRCWTVRKKKTKSETKGRKIFSKCTTKEKAQKQLRLLRAIQNNPNFRANGRQTKKLRRSKRLQSRKKR